MKRVLVIAAVAVAAVVGPGPAAHADPCDLDPTCILTICVSGAGVLEHRFCFAE